MNRKDIKDIFPFQLEHPQQHLGLQQLHLQEPHELVEDRLLEREDTPVEEEGRLLTGWDIQEEAVKEGIPVEGDRLVEGDTLVEGDSLAEEGRPVEEGSLVEGDSHFQQEDKFEEDNLVEVGSLVEEDSLVEGDIHLAEGGSFAEEGSPGNMATARKASPAGTTGRSLPALG